MKKKYYIGLDQGTTGTTTRLLDETWNVGARSAGTLAESDGIYVHGIV